MDKPQTDHTMTITAKNGVRFLARIIRTGDRYGLDDCLIVGEGASLKFSGEGPLVEFYDTRYPHTRFGQFVSRYNVNTILADAPGHHGPATGGGLDLLTYVDDWKIDAQSMWLVRQWLHHETGLNGL